MTNEKWGEILDKILGGFEVLSHDKDQIDVAEVETIVFNGPLGTIKLIRTVRPAVIDKKIIGAHRRGKSQAQYEYIYSDTDKVSRVAAYKEVDGGWQEIDSSIF